MMNKLDWTYRQDAIARAAEFHIPIFYKGNLKPSQLEPWREEFPPHSPLQLTLEDSHA